MYRGDTSDRDRGGAGCWRSPYSGCSTRARCTGTNSASGLANLLGAFRAFSYGSLYPTLRRLSEAGWITEEAPDSVTGPCDQVAAGQAGLPPDRRGQGALRRTARRRRAGGVRRRRIRGAAGVLRPDPLRHPAADPRGSAPASRGAARRHAQVAGTHPRADGPLHARNCKSTVSSRSTARSAGSPS